MALTGVGIGGGLSGMAYLASGLQSCGVDEASYVFVVIQSYGSPSLPAAQLVAPAYMG